MIGFINNITSTALTVMQENTITGMFLLFIWACFLSTDFLMWGLVSANPHLWAVYATVTTVASVTGGYIDYVIGEKAGRPVVHKFMIGSKEKAEAKLKKIESTFEKYGSMTIFIVALTPLPYKLCAVIAGIIGISKKEFILWSLVGRGIRFFAGSYVVYLLSTQKELGEIIMKYKPLLIGIVAIIIIIKIVSMVRSNMTKSS